MHNNWGFGYGVLVLMTGCQVCWTQDFGYNGEKGPSHWGEQYNECSGKHQSPINIDLLSVRRAVLPALKMDGFDVPPDRMTLKNNGHTVMITVETQMKPTISGGPLDGDYEFAQFHFHWGDNDTFGSEDLIDGRSFPMELHMVFFNKQYKNFKQATQHPDGLCVLAFFYDLHDKDNENYDEFSEILSQVVHPESNATFNKPITLFELMPEDLVHYFTYNGSLTTPPCSEIVTWIDFKDRILLSHRQIQMFRDLLDEDGHILTHNFRPIQPLGDRIVLFNIKDDDDNTLYMTDSPDNDIRPETDAGTTFNRADSPKDDIPPEVDNDTNDDLSGGDKNVLNDSPDNNLDDEKVNRKTGKKSKLESGSSTIFLPWYLLCMTIVIFMLSDRRVC